MIIEEMDRNMFIVGFFINHYQYEASNKRDLVGGKLMKKDELYNIFLSMKNIYSILF